MKEEELNELVKEHYGFTIDEIDEDIGKLSLRVNQLEYNNKKLQEENKSLQSQLKAKEELIEEAISHIRDCCNMDSKWVNLHFDYAQNVMSENQVDDLLEILSKGENK